MRDDPATEDRPRGLSIVIPSYNSAPWLPATLTALDTALAAVPEIDAEVVLVDDGSNDETPEVVARCEGTLRVPLKLVRTENQGRFLARWTGATGARFDEIMLLDSRVLLDSEALRHVATVRASGEGHGPWNAHADTSASTSLVGLFWEVPTYVFWGAYRANPRPMLITPENFDRLPKGTTCFLVNRALYMEASRACWPEENAHLVSDDTMILRHIAQRQQIRIDPGFRVEYRPRQSIRRFLSHSFVRGTLFVSSYAGTSRVRDVLLVALALSLPVAAAALLAAASAGRLALVAALLVGALVVGVATPAAIALRRGCPQRAVRSFLTFVIPFGAVFWAGLCRGLVVHRRAWLRGRDARRAGDVQAPAGRSI